MARKYHTLLTRDPHLGGPWAIHFGDYDREVVATERDDLMASGFGGMTYRKRDTKIITTGPRQVDINNAVEALNAKRVGMIG